MEELDNRYFNHGNMKEVNISSEMREDFLSYSMSVIIDRALPDVRDGMKPVHRRVLWANPPTSSVKLWVSITRTAIRRSTIQWSVWRSHSPTVTLWLMAMVTSVPWMVMVLRQCVTPKRVCPRFPWNYCRISKRKRSTGVITTMPDIVNRLFYQAVSLICW